MKRTVAAGLSVVIIALGGALRLHHLRAVGGSTAQIESAEGYYEAGISQLSCHALGLASNPAPTDYLAPIYPSFFALTESFFALPSPYHPRAVKTLLSTLAVATACMLGWLLFSPLAGVFAGALLAFDATDILEVTKLNVHGFYGIGLLALGIAVVLWLERRSVWRAGLVGMMLAATLLTRGAHFPFPLLFAGACLWRWDFPEGRWRALLPVAAATALFLAPMAIRNGLQFGNYSPFDLKGSCVLVVGTVGVPESAPIADAIAAAESIEPGFKARGLEGRPLHKALIRAAMVQIMRAPWTFAGYCLRRFYLFWGGLWPYLALGAYALWRRRGDRPLEALILTAASLSGYALAGGSPQFHVTAVPLLSVIAGAGLASLPFAGRAPAVSAPAKSRLRAGIALLPGVFAVVYAAMIVFLSLELRDHFRPGPGASASDPCPDGRALHSIKLASMQAGDRGDLALIYAEQASAALNYPDRDKSADSRRSTEVLRILARAERLQTKTDEQRRRISSIYRALKDYRLAEASLAPLLEKRPRDAGLWLERAELEARAGEREAARRSLARAEGSPFPPGDRIRVVRLYRELKEYRRALAALKPLLETSPRDAGLWLERAELEAQTGERGAALKSLERAEGLGALSEEQRRRSVWLYREQKEYRLAEAALEPLLEKRPEDPGLWLVRAELAARMDRREEALRFLARAEAAGPGESERIQMALLYRQLEAYGPALALLKPLLASRPGDAGLWIERADIEALTGAREAALASAARAEAAGPGAEQRRRIAELRRRARERPAALEPAKPGADAWLERAEREARANEKGAALRSLARAEALGALSEEQRRRIAGLYREQKEYRLAEARLAPLLEKRPRDAGLWLESAELEVLTGEPDKALESLARAEAAAPDDEDRGGERRRRIALGYQSLGKHDRAVAVLDRLIRQYPREGTYYSDKGLCEYLKGDAAAAIGDLETAIKLKPAFIPAYLTLGAIHAAGGRYEDALKVYDAGLAKSPEGDAAPLRKVLLDEREAIMAKAR